MNIYSAELKDIDTIVNFNIKMANETEDITLSPLIVKRGVQTVLKDSSKGFYLLVFINHKAVGQLLITKEWSDWRNGEFWWIQSVYVHPDFRRKGIYRALHNHVVNLTKKNGNACGIRLYVDADNHKAQSVYWKMGMNQTRYLLYESDWSGPTQ